MTQTQRYLLSLLSKALFCVETDRAYVFEDYTGLKNEALSQAVFPLIYPEVKDVLPSKVKDDWGKTNALTLANNIRVNHEHAELHTLMEQMDVPYVVLKGLCSASYYPDPLLRTMGDVDFLVSRSDVEKVGRELEKKGFEANKAHHNFHIAYIRKKSDWEMHYSVGGIPNNSCGERIKSYLSDVIEKAEVCRLGNLTCRIPGKFHHGVIMLLHLIMHIKSGGGIGLRHLCDWAAYVNKVDISRFQRQYLDMGLWVFACQLTAVSSEYLGLPERDWCSGCNAGFMDELMEDIFSSGNFGIHDDQRSPSNNIVKESNIILSLAARARDYYPFAEKYKLLLPLGMGLYSCRFLWERLIGRRKWISFAAIKEAKKRKKLYEQFRVFEA